MRKDPTTFVLTLLCTALLFVSCSSKTEEERAQDVVVETLTAFYAGDIDCYISHSDFRTKLSSRQDSLLRMMLDRYVDEVRRKGGLQVVEPLQSRLDDDSTATVSYALRFASGTRETCITQLRKVDGEWEMCVLAGW